MSDASPAMTWSDVIRNQKIVRKMTQREFPGKKTSERNVFVCFFEKKRVGVCFFLLGVIVELMEI